MSEREYARNRSTDDGDAHQGYPGDFSADEAAFACELRELFPIDQEVLPPLFTQTLIEDEWRSAVVPGFEEKLAYRVFRQLSLQRSPLFERSSWRGKRSFLSRLGRPMAGAIAATLLVMLFTMMAASPSFAAGLSILLGQTGVIQVNHYPANVASSLPNTSTTPPALVAEKPMPLFWLGPSYGRYSYDDYWQVDAQDWSDGPIMDIHYSLTGATGGTGILDIREFRVSPQYSAVQQVVQEGSIDETYVDSSQAVYVDGQWDAMNGNRWHFGLRSELILERAGVIIWIVGDQRDGMTEDELVKVASHLTTDGANLNTLRRSSIRGVGRSLESWYHDPSSGEVYAAIPSGFAPGSGSLTFVKMKTVGTGMMTADGG